MNKLPHYEDRKVSCPGIEPDMLCPLCKSKSKLFHKEEYFSCLNCSGIFLNPNSYTDRGQEKRRYEEHNNDVNDKSYQKFVMPIVNYVLMNYTPEHTGLDFGSGTGPVVSKLLGDKGYKTYLYDPFFADDKAVLKRMYDYIACCEVIEHFHRPDIEFKKLRLLLKPQGRLIMKTHLYSSEKDFSSWYYKNDPTHVFIYRGKTIEYIAGRFDFVIEYMDERLIVLAVEVSEQ